MTIEDKAERYDELLKKLRKAKEDNNVCDERYCCVIDDIVPELKESEDERIRKRIIHALHGDVLELSEIKEAIAWLEKQGTPAKLSEEEQNRFAKGVLTSCALSFINYLDAHKHEGKMCVSNGECEDIENAFHNAMWDKLHRYYGKYIEKQSEHSVSPLFTFDDVLAIQCAMAYAKFQDRELDVALKKLHDKVYDAYHDSKNHNIESQDGLKGEQILANIAKTCKDEQKPNPYSGASFDYNGHTWGMCARDNGVEILFDGELKAFLSLEKSFIYPIHSQPELAPKSALENIDNINDKGYCCVVTPQDKSALESTKEKVDNANNVEPKFKVGDWIIFNGLTLYIKEIVKGYYRTISKGGITNSYDWGIDNTARLWNITDAKDGDVLMSGEVIFIFNKIDSKWLHCYCSCHKDGSFIIDYDLMSAEYFNEVYPATKEQREQLEKAIADAGYVWLSGKKELKKIEDELIADVEIPFGAKDSELEEVFYSIPNGFHAEIEDDKVVIKKGEKKYWSEEDEDILKSIIATCELAEQDRDSSPAKHLLKKQTNWLKFLKYRVQLQPKQEWSEEDEKYVKDLADYFTGGLSLKHAEEEIADWLESLKDRYTWKPSGEHYELEEFAKIVRCNLTGISKAVQKLFEAKYLQLTGNKMYEGFKD